MYILYTVHENVYEVNNILQYGNCTTVGTSALRGGLIKCDIDFWEKWHRFGKGFQAKGLVCCAHTIQYMQYCRSVHSLYIYANLVHRTLVNMVPQSYILAVDLPTIQYTLHNYIYPAKEQGWCNNVTIDHLFRLQRQLAGQHANQQTEGYPQGSSVC